MADNFGLKIGIEGEKDFKNALRDINSSFKVLGSEMNLVSSEFDKNDRSMESLTARNRVLNKEIDTQTLKIETLQKALDNASASFGENDKRTLAWQVQLNNAKADLNGLEKELKQNDTALSNVGNEFNSAEKQSGQFEKAIKTSADTAEKAESRFSNLGSTLGKIGVAIGAGVVAIGAAAVSAGKALANTTVSASAYADEILTQATVTGMSTESLQAYKYAAELIDTPLETVTATMSKNIKSMASARDGSKATADAYKALGISVTDAHGNLRDGETVYWQAIDALGKMQNETERDALAMQIFGKSARELNPLIEQGSSGMAKLTDEAKRMGAVMSEDVMNGIKDFFGIHSPSSLMENQIGKNIGLGVASGITKSGLTIKDAFKNVIPTDLDATLSYNANFSNLPERTNSIIDYSSMKRVFVEALSEMNLSVALDGYKVGEIIKNTVIKEVFA